MIKNLTLALTQVSEKYQQEKIKIQNLKREVDNLKKSPIKLGLPPPNFSKKPENWQLLPEKSSLESEMEVVDLREAPSPPRTPKFEVISNGLSPISDLTFSTRLEKYVAENPDEIETPSASTSVSDLDDFYENLRQENLQLKQENEDLYRQLRQEQKEKDYFEDQLYIADDQLEVGKGQYEDKCERIKT